MDKSNSGEKQEVGSSGTSPFMSDTASIVGGGGHIYRRRINYVSNIFLALVVPPSPVKREIAFINRRKKKLPMNTNY